VDAYEIPHRNKFCNIMYKDQVFPYYNQFLLLLFNPVADVNGVTDRLEIHHPHGIISIVVLLGAALGARCVVGAHDRRHPVYIRKCFSVQSNKTNVIKQTYLEKLSRLFLVLLELLLLLSNTSLSSSCTVVASALIRERMSARMGAG
jgi:hypothetical protein